MTLNPTSSSASSEPEIRSRYVDVLGARMHYLDGGTGYPILFLHGNPTSSRLWRNILPTLARHGRVIAPDLIGFGKSDKPDIGYRFFDHARYVDGFIEALGLTQLTLVLHDWGSALGFHHAHRYPDRIRGLAFMEAILRPAKWSEFPGGFKLAFRLFRTPGTGWLTVMALNQFIRGILPAAVVRKMSKKEIDAYAEPFPTIRSRRPVLVWPREIPIDGHPSDVHAAVSEYSEWLKETPIPKLLLHARPGGLVPEATVKWCEAKFPKLESVAVGAGLHYIQEDQPEAIARALEDWYLRVVEGSTAQAPPPEALPSDAPASASS